MDSTASAAAANKTIRDPEAVTSRELEKLEKKVVGLIEELQVRSDT